MAQQPFQPLDRSLRLPSAHVRSHSRSSSRSPERNPSFSTHDLDPLLSNLSPESTLRALTATNSVQSCEKSAQDLLAKSIAEVTESQRALGIRAAVAAQKLREWKIEIASWPWPSKEDALLGKGLVPPINTTDDTTRELVVSLSGIRDDFMDNYLGSLPVSLVERYSSRIDEIHDGMWALDVDELKEHILNAHIPSRSRPPSSNGATPRDISYNQLSDFTAVVTTIILRALPVLSHLNGLINTWDVRITVLRKIPRLLQRLRTARTEIDAAMESLESPTPPSENDVLYSKSSLTAARGNLEYLVVLARSDFIEIRDLLKDPEDREDREKDALPEVWKNDLESILADFHSWAVKAESLAIRNEWSLLNTQADDVKTAPEGEAKVTTLEDQTEIEPPTTHQSTMGISISPTTLVMDQGMPITQNVAVQLNDRRSTSGAHPKSSSVSDGSFTEENPTLDSSELSRVEDVDVQPVHDPSPSPVNVQISNEGPEMRKAALDSPHPMPADSEARPSNGQFTNDSITGSGPRIPQPSKLEKSLEIIQKDGNYNSHGETNQSDGKGIENEDPNVDSAAGSSYTAKPNPTNLPCFDEDAHSEVLLDETTSPPLDCSTQPSPEINVTSPAQSDVAVSPRNASFGGRRDSTGPTDAIGSTSAVPLSIKHESQIPPKKLKRKPWPLDLAAITAKSHRRSISGDSLASDCMSGASSPEIKDALTATSHGSAMVVEAASPRTQPNYSLAKPSRTYSSQTARDPGLHRRTEPPSPAESVELNRTASLPLQRFIDDYHGPNEDDDYKSIRPAEIKRASVTSIEIRPKTELKSIVVTRKGSSSSISDIKTAPFFRHSTSNLSQYSDPKGGGIIEEEENSPYPCPSISADNLAIRRKSSAEEQSPLLRVFDRRQRATQSPASPVSPISPTIPRRSSKRLSKCPESRSSGSFGHRNNNQDPTPPALASPSFSPLTPVNSNTKPNHVKSSEERLEDKINSILTTIPAKIKLGAAPNQKVAAPSSHESSGKGDSFGSVSPRSTPTRNSTPTPSLTLTPAFTRSKRPNARSSDEPSVRLYHLHRGGKSAPVKLFVRPVGENGERVMVRVGGGWADLGEYLREYAVHHGHRTVSDGFDVQNLPTNSSPAYSSAASTITPTTNNGRSTPISRPGSALSTRPSSSLAVRKTRNFTVSSADPPGLTSANVQRISEDSHPFPYIPKRHRQSMSSTTSAGLTSAAGESPYSSTTPNTAMHSTPLGLSGPNPKARHASLTPESEAWVEGVIGQARQTSSSLKFKRSIPGFRSSRFMSGKDDASNNDKSSNETNTRSVSDIGLNRRVFLRGLGKEKAKGKD